VAIYDSLCGEAGDKASGQGFPKAVMEDSL